MVARQEGYFLCYSMGDNYMIGRILMILCFIYLKSGIGVSHISTNWQKLNTEVALNGLKDFCSRREIAIQQSLVVESSISLIG